MTSVRCSFVESQKRELRQCQTNHHQPALLEEQILQQLQQLGEGEEGDHLRWDATTTTRNPPAAGRSIAAPALPGPVARVTWVKVPPAATRHCQAGKEMANCLAIMIGGAPNPESLHLAVASSTTPVEPACFLAARQNSRLGGPKIHLPASAPASLVWRVAENEENKWVAEETFCCTMSPGAAIEAQGDWGAGSPHAP